LDVSTKFGLPPMKRRLPPRGAPALAVLFLFLLLGPGPLGAPTANLKAAIPVPRISTDPRVEAFLQAYGPLIDDVTYLEDDAVFTASGNAIHFQDGRMLGEDHLDRAEDYQPFFFPYSLGPLDTPPAPEDGPGQSTDVLEAFFGRREGEIRLHCESYTFLGRKLFVNSLLIDPLRGVEVDIRAAAKADPAVREWMDGLKVAYSFMDKGIAGSATRSYHAWGLAVDLVPRSYGGKHVYWRWSRVFDREGWSNIPLSRRWSPPPAVVEAFEAHGFLWGGKWAHFDQIHFEYRPEILLYNRMVTER
jgi:hypothetical protein